MRFMGMDVHRDHCEVAIVEAGKVRSAVGSQPGQGDLKPHVRRVVVIDPRCLRAWDCARPTGATPKGLGAGRLPPGLPEGFL